MPVREKPDEWVGPERRREPRGSVEREVGVSHAVEGRTTGEGPALARVSPIEAAKQRSGMGHHDRGRRRRKLRFAFIAGAVALAVLPWAMRIAGGAGAVSIDATLGSGLLRPALTALKLVIVVATLGVVSWRLRRRASSGLRASYFAGTWMMAFGVGLVAVDNLLAGTVLFDGGALLLCACAVSDLVQRRDRPSVAAPDRTTPVA